MLLDLLKRRYSVRDFSDKDVSQKIIKYILEAGRLSPSGGNEQPWLFGLVENENLIKDISKIAYNQKWIENAKFLVVLCTKIISDQREGRDIQKARFPDLEEDIESLDKEIYNKLNMEEHQTKIPGTHMSLAGLEHGIGSCWVSKL